MSRLTKPDNGEVFGTNLEQYSVLHPEPHHLYGVLEFCQNALCAAEAPLRMSGHIKSSHVAGQHFFQTKGVPPRQLVALHVWDDQTWAQLSGPALTSRQAGGMMI